MIPKEKLKLSLQERFSLALQVICTQPKISYTEALLQRTVETNFEGKLLIRKGAQLHSKKGANRPGLLAAETSARRSIGNPKGEAIVYQYNGCRHVTE